MDFTAYHFFEENQSGFLITDEKGIILQCNKTLRNWLGVDVVAGKKLGDLLRVGSRIYFETHLFPLLKMQGYFEEVVVALQTASGDKLMALLNANEYKKEGIITYIHYSFSKAVNRLQYEQNLFDAKSTSEKHLLEAKETVTIREQLIAVLAHDLRNPLNAISMATQMMEESELSEMNRGLLLILKRSGHRMSELINNITDFARTRLGGGIVLDKREVLLKPVIQQVINELQLVFPGTTVVSDQLLDIPVVCDPDRIGQLVSNLLANAFTHGSPEAPVIIKMSYDDQRLKIQVCNGGNRIPEHLHEKLFEPFTREGERLSQNGLGLGLYISAEIARAHNGQLTCTSTEQETCFTFTM